MYSIGIAIKSPALADLGGVIVKFEISPSFKSTFHWSSGALPLFSLSIKSMISLPEASPLPSAAFISAADLSVSFGFSGFTIPTLNGSPGFTADDVTLDVSSPFPSSKDWL